MVGKKLIGKLGEKLDVDTRMFKAILILLGIFTNALQPITTVQINITETPHVQVRPLPLHRLTVRREPDGAVF